MSYLAEEDLGIWFEQCGKALSALSKATQKPHFLDHFGVNPPCRLSNVWCRALDMVVNALFWNLL